MCNGPHWDALQFVTAVIMPLPFPSLILITFLFGSVSVIITVVDFHGIQVVVFASHKLLGRMFVHMRAMRTSSTKLKTKLM